MKHKMQPSEVTQFEALKEFLGYQDERSVIRWCRKHSIPVLKAGKKKYVASHLLTHIIENQLVTFVKGEAGVLKSSTEPRYKPKNELVKQYLQKYESGNKSKAA